MDLVRVLDGLDAEEPERTHDRDREARDEPGLLVLLRAAHSPRRRQRRHDQHRGVDRAPLHVEVVAGVGVDLGVVVAIQDVRHEQRREEQHFLGEEEPDAELGGVELVLGVVVVVLDETRAVVAVPVVVVTVVVVTVVVPVIVVVVVGAHGDSLSRGHGDIVARPP